MNYFYAVENVGVPVLLIRDNQIIGEGYSQTSAHGMISIEMRDDRAKALIENTPQVKMWEQKFPEKKFKWSMYKFCRFTGQYLDMSQDDPDMLCKELEGVRVVDKQKFRYGMVPDSFKDVPGYRDFFNQLEKETNEKPAD